VPIKDILDDDIYEQAERDVACVAETYEGYVVANNDPEKLGRVKVFVPGMFDESTDPELCSDWIMPIGNPGGGAGQVGLYAPPPVGANVVLIFVLGDLEEPRFLTGPWGTPDDASGAAVPDVLTYLNDTTDWLGVVGVAPTPEEAPSIRILEFSGMQLVFDPRPGLEKLVICDMARNPVTGAYMTAVVIDVANKMLELKSTVSINIESEGAIKLQSRVGQIEFVFGADDAATGEVALRRLLRVGSTPV
jgi:hypothetical protein